MVKNIRKFHSPILAWIKFQKFELENSTSQKFWMKMGFFLEPQIKNTSFSLVPLKATYMLFPNSRVKSFDISKIGSHVFIIIHKKSHFSVSQNSQLFSKIIPLFLFRLSNLHDISPKIHRCVERAKEIFEKIEKHSKLFYGIFFQCKISENLSHAWYWLGKAFLGYPTFDNIFHFRYQILKKIIEVFDF